MATKQITKNVPIAEFFGQPIKIGNHVLFIDPVMLKSGYLTVDLWRVPAVKRQHLTTRPPKD